MLTVLLQKCRAAMPEINNYIKNSPAYTFYNLDFRFRIDPCSLRQSWERRASSHNPFDQFVISILYDLNVSEFGPEIINQGMVISPSILI